MVSWIPLGTDYGNGFGELLWGLVQEMVWGLVWVCVNITLDQWFGDCFGELV